MAKFSRAHKIKLKLDKEQFTYCSQSAGVARFAYNWALSKWQTLYQEYLAIQAQKTILCLSIKELDRLDSIKPPSEGDLRKLFNQQKKIDKPSDYDSFPVEQQRQYFPWAKDVSKYAPQQAIQNLGEAFKRFFKTNSGYPKFKKKGINDSFYLGNDVFSISQKNGKSYLQLPKLKTPILLEENLRFSGKINSLSISRQGNNWFASFSMEAELPITPAPQRSCGIDLGVSDLATLYADDGEVIKFKNPKGYRKHLNRLKRLQKSLSKKKKKSKNRWKAQMKVAKLHARVANIRADNLHKVTTYITSNFNHIKIEDLNVSGMLKNHKLAMSIADSAFYKFKQMLEYKSERTASQIFKVDRFFPSSQLCSNCGNRYQSLKLSERQWKCEQCGEVHDRDINASKNILNCEQFKPLFKEKKVKSTQGRFKKIPSVGGEFKPMEEALPGAKSITFCTKVPETGVKSEEVGRITNTFLKPTE